MNSFDLDDVFGSAGLLSKTLPGYIPREGQITMSRAVQAAMLARNPLLVEAPCGTGKTIAYLVPACLAPRGAGSVVVATANIALQEQLIGKDLPFLARTLPRPFSFALLKGRNNYLCRAQYKIEAERFRSYTDKRPMTVEQREHYRAILDWGERTETGDVSELSFSSPAIWRWFSSSTDECKGDDCPFGGECFATDARARAKDASVVVTNYHLVYPQAKYIGLNLANKNGDSAGFLPFVSTLVCDEAHEAEDIARSFAGADLSLGSFYSLAKRATKLKLVDRANAIRRTADTFFDAIERYAKSHKGEAYLRTSRGFPTRPLLDAVRALDATLRARMKGEEEDLGMIIETTEKADARVVLRLAGKRIVDLLSFEGYEQDGLTNTVFFIEASGEDRAEQYRVKSRELDVSQFLRQQVWSKVPTSIVTSATLAIAGNLGKRRESLGLPASTTELIVPSPFDFRAQSILCVPREAELPASPREGEEKFADAVARAFAMTLKLCEGRTLGLFTSWRNLNLVYDRVAALGLPYRLLKQGDLPRSELTKIFREDEHSVLFGVDSFWQGIDVPGDALIAVVIDKLPFPNLSDPVTAAIKDLDGSGSFESWFIPEAVTKFRQGVGRLIRRTDDLGIVVVCDRRLVDLPYGKKFRDSLPGWVLCKDIATATRFLAGATKKRACAREACV